MSVFLHVNSLLKLETRVFSTASFMTLMCVYFFSSFSQGYLDQFEEHRPSYQVIVNTESFVLEHTSCLQHDDIKKGVSEFVQEFDALEESAKVGKML